MKIEVDLPAASFKRELLSKPQKGGAAWKAFYPHTSVFFQGGVFVFGKHVHSFDRWQIEVNFHDEKDLMGLSEAQVWSERSIPRLPAFVAATYSILLLASIIRFNDRRDGDIFMERPRWRRGEEPGRPSCLDLLALLRGEALEQPEKVEPLGIKVAGTNLITKAAA
jgi:hypothetical protein